jgi:DNA-binding transcriptional MerR regulator/DNA-directed RNA polymerase subunit RPC12/RpoP
MSKYTTGEIAKMCEVSVRTVQFYDTRGLLTPSGLTEGGRRLYSGDDLKQMRLILMLKSLGLSLDSIKGILESENQSRVLLLLLDEQMKRLDAEMGQMQKQTKSIKTIKEAIKTSDTIPVKSISGIDNIMNGKKKLKKTQIIMLIVGIIMDIVEIGTIYYWIKYGNWVPFAVGMPFVVLAAVLLVRAYYKNAAYICAECNAKFRPKFWEFFFAGHTPRTRKLTCTECGHKGWCVETAAD